MVTELYPLQPLQGSSSPLKLVVYLSSPTLSILDSTDSFFIVVGGPSTPQPATVTPSMGVTENLATTLPLTLTFLPTRAEDSLRDFFETASGVGGG